MCLVLEFTKRNVEIWDEAFEDKVCAIKEEKGAAHRRCLPQVELKNFVRAHRNCEEVMRSLFTKHYCTSSALLGKTTSAGQDTEKSYGKFGSSIQWLRSVARKISCASSATGADNTKRLGIIASMMREAHSSKKSTRNLLLKAHREEGERDDDMSLPQTYEEANGRVISRTDRFVVGGRGIISNGSNVGITGIAEPVMGVGQAIAIGLCRQVPFQPKLAHLLVNGPLKYPGAHYVLRSSGGIEKIPQKGFVDEREALEWARDVIVLARHIQDGDLVGVTRSPFVSPHNHLYMQVRVLGGMTLRPHDIILSATDADFDGDGMILYVPNDMVAKEQWKAQMPSRLLTYQSGLQAQATMLDGRFGLESSLCAEVSASVFLSVLSCLTDLVADDVKIDVPFNGDHLYKRKEILRLCGAQRFLEDGKHLNDEIRRLLVQFGCRSAMRLLFNAQNAGKALAESVALPGFHIKNFLPPPGLDLCQRGVISALAEKRFSRGKVDMYSARRDKHEVIVGVLEPVMALTYLGHDDEDLRIVAEIAQQIKLENGKAISDLRKKLIIKSKNANSTTYMQEDLRLKIKSVHDAAQMAVGILRGSVSAEPRTVAAFRWPHDQLSLIISERMSSNVSSVGSQILANNATEGMSSKSQIEKNGQIRNYLTILLSGLHRDHTCSLCIGDVQLFSGRSMPISLFVSPPALINSATECDLTFVPCPWETLDGPPPPPMDGDEGEVIVLEGRRPLPGKKRHRLEQELAAEDEELEEVEGAYCTRDHILRELSGAKLPICCGALISKGHIDESFRIEHPPVLCKQCWCPLRVSKNIQNLECSGCGEVIWNRVLQFWNGVAVPEVSEPVVGVPHPDGQLRRMVQSGDVRLRKTQGGRRKQARIVLYPEKLQAAHQRGAKRAGAGENPGFLRLELDPICLEAAGFTELDQFDLERRISLMVSPNATPGDASACVMSWKAPSWLSTTSNVVLVHVYGLLGSSSNASEAVTKGRFGIKGVSLHCSTSSSDTFQMSFHKATDKAVDAAIAAIPPFAARRLRIVEDGPACLRHGGPEETERQMVLEQCNGNFQRSGPAHVLAAKRTAEGGLLSVKSRPRDRPCELMVKGNHREAHRSLAYSALLESNSHAPNEWLGRPTEVGVSAVLLFEDPVGRTKKTRLAQSWNLTTLPDDLRPSTDIRHSSQWLTFEERSRVIAIRSLQIIIEGYACKNKDASPDRIACKELEDKTLPFAIARNYSDENHDTKIELVWISSLTPIPDEYHENPLKRRRMSECTDAATHHTSEVAPRPHKNSNKKEHLYLIFLWVG
jgi:hypothetical protein